LSRPRSARGASPAPARAGRPGVYVATPKSDVYVALLGIALGAMVVGCVLLVMVWQRYEFKVKASFVPAPRTATVACASSYSEKICTVRL
jgi:hypothetical protein